MVAASRVRIYKAEEIDLDDLAAKAQAILQKKPFVWQLEITEAILRGEDVIVDVGTGSGKTLCFALPLLKDETDMVLVVSPLTALMVDQVRYSSRSKMNNSHIRDRLRKHRQPQLPSVQIPWPLPAQIIYTRWLSSILDSKPY